MKLFISWSQDFSMEVAKALETFITSVLQNAEPWMSTSKLKPGDAWKREIFENLQGVNTGMLVVTKENFLKPWLLFEAGAISKGDISNKIIVFLVDLTVDELGDPLQTYQTCDRSRDSMWKMIEGINRPGQQGAVPSERIRSTFVLHHEEFIRRLEEIETKFKKDEAEKAEIPPKTPEMERLDELHELTQATYAELFELRSKMEAMNMNPLAALKELQLGDIGLLLHLSKLYGAQRANKPSIDGEESPLASGGVLAKAGPLPPNLNQSREE
jgi:hypothetical protein